MSGTPSSTVHPVCDLGTLRLGRGRRTASPGPALIQWVDEAVAQGGSVLMHCVGGLGRSGMAGASYLRRRGASAAEALKEVRRARSLRAVETPLQEAFVRAFPV